MKLIMAIINNDDASSVQEALSKNNFQATKLASTGNFLAKGNTTLLIVTEDEKTDAVMNIIGKYSSKRIQTVASQISPTQGMYNPIPIEVAVGGATVFVLNVERFEKL